MASFMFLIISVFLLFFIIQCFLSESDTRGTASHPGESLSWPALYEVRLAGAQNPEMKDAGNM